MKPKNEAAMNETEFAKDPSSYSWLAYAWIVGIGALGGLVSYIRKVNAGFIHKWSIMEFIGEIVTSAFVGVLTFWICEWAKLSPLLTAAFVGVAGHMGSRCLFMFENWLKRKFAQITK
jgi:hypothetical protein